MADRIHLPPGTLDLLILRAKARISNSFRITLLTLFLLLNLPLACPAQAGSAPIKVGEAALRADASVYPIPTYPADSIRAHHTGRVVIEVVVAPITSTSPLARVQSTRVLETPDRSMAHAVIASLKDARYMPLFDGAGNVVQASGRVVWEFRINEQARSDRPECNAQAID